MTWRKPVATILLVPTSLLVLYVTLVIMRRVMSCGMYRSNAQPHLTGFRVFGARLPCGWTHDSRSRPAFAVQSSCGAALPGSV